MAAWQLGRCGNQRCVNDQLHGVDIHPCRQQSPRNQNYHRKRHGHKQSAIYYCSDPINDFDRFLVAQSQDIVRSGFLAKLDFDTFLAHEVVKSPKIDAQIIFDIELRAELLWSLKVQLKLDKIRGVVNDLPVDDPFRILHLAFNFAH